MNAYREGRRRQTDEHTLQQLLADLQLHVSVNERMLMKSEEAVTVIDDQGNLRHFWALHLNVINDQNLRRGLPHDAIRRAAEFVQGCQLSTSIHVSMLLLFNVY